MGLTIGSRLSLAVMMKLAYSWKGPGGVYGFFEACDCSPAGWVCLADSNHCSYAEAEGPNIIAMLQILSTESDRVALALKSIAGTDLACSEMSMQQTLSEVWQKFVDELQLRKLGKSNLLKIVLPSCRILEEGNREQLIAELVAECEP
eukprot:TRINITY_DN22630_c0_g2_i2.p1 TRINITY_DN22630_c0_g2~~TRINITY_DN22630_c0_g2_i2.p1  ORF type:complete len:148 (+),score=27.06 TRINITY_DN22630_c0_g2_i2:106-549(+)